MRDIEAIGEIAPAQHRHLGRQRNTAPIRTDYDPSQMAVGQHILLAAGAIDDPAVENRRRFRDAAEAAERNEREESEERESEERGRAQRLVPGSDARTL